MKLRSIVGLSLLLAGLLLSGCSKPTADSLTVDMIAKMKELTAELHAITDESSSKSASDKIKGTIADWKKLKEQMDAIKPTADEEKAVAEKHSREMAEVQGALFGEMLRIGMNPALSTPLQDAMKGFDGIK